MLQPYDYASFVEKTRPFTEWMLEWYNNLPQLALNDLAENPDEVAIVSVDVIKGFCTVGPLASERVNKIVEPIVKLFSAAWDKGIRDIVLLQDTHDPDAVEFGAYAPHCIRGTEESEAVDEYKALPFFDELTILPKNSINAGVMHNFDHWMQAHPHKKTFIVVGDCSDICTYQTTTHLRTRANELQLHGVRVIAPVSTIDTYDLDVETAQNIGATPHDADLMHVVFLYSMMLNGIEVVSEIA